MSESYKQHFDLASERFMVAMEQLENEHYQTAANLFINASINYHNAICQKFLNLIPSHKQHSDTSYFRELSPFLLEDSKKYKEAYTLLISYKSQADYGAGISANSAEIIKRKATKIKEIAERLL